MAQADRHSSYPPQRHVDLDLEHMCAVVQRLPFATVISVGDGAPVVSQLPLILDRDRGEYGVLFGHVDRNNPQMRLLDGAAVTIIFHGPNSYISPYTYGSSQLPTWNSISVHVTGRATLIDDRERLIRGLQSICRAADPGPQAYRLPADDPRIAGLIDYIVGFEVEIESMIGRFKLSQDRDEADRAAAARALIQRSEAGEADLINALCGLEARSPAVIR